MNEVKEKTQFKGIMWIYVAIWIVLLITMWIVYGLFAPNLLLFIIALVITVGGPILYYGLLWYKTSK
jgi:hypothetical protein